MNIWWQQLVVVMAGGAFGAAGRFLIGGWMTRHVGSGFPWGTLTANLLGCLLAGFLLIWLEGRGASALLWRAFLMVGVLGALTTFSALMLELFLLHRSGVAQWGGAYLAASLLGGLSMVWLGVRIGALVR